MKLTAKQRNAMHLYCQRLAEALDDAGFEVTDGVVLQLPVSWTKENVKANIWKPVMTALYPSHSSSEDAERVEISEIYEQVNKIVAERTGVSVPFPSEDEFK